MKKIIILILFLLPITAMSQIKVMGQRIVSLAPNITEILFALDAGDKIIGLSSGSNYPEQTNSIKKIGSFWQPDIEAIVTCKPDLILTLQFNQQQSCANQLTSLGYNVKSFKIESIEDLYKAITKISHLVNKDTQGKALNLKLKKQFQKIEAQYKPYRKMRTIFVVQKEPLRLAGEKTFINHLIQLAGGQNAIGQTLAHYPTISKEELLICDPEVIIHTTTGQSDIAAEELSTSEFWHKQYPYLPAVKNNRIYTINSDICLRIGPRLPQGLAEIARCIHLDSGKK